MEELLKIIEGYNQEKINLTNKLLEGEMIQKARYEQNKEYIRKFETRLVEIDKKISIIVERLTIKPKEK